MEFRVDCRHFLGYKPCVYKRECPGCPYYDPIRMRILIIKLAAMGDVLRTTTILHGLRARYHGAQISWLTDSNILPLLEGNHYIDRLLGWSAESVLQLEEERFDIAICLDKEPRAAALINRLRAERKLGFGWDERGVPIPLNEEARYAYLLGISDELKFRQNTKSYQEIIYDCLGLAYRPEYGYVFPDLEDEIESARRHLAELGVGESELKIGLNTGSGEVYATKRWTVDGFTALADLLDRELHARPLLLGGPAEAERNAEIASRLGPRVVDTGCFNTLRRFAGIVGNCDLIVTGDTLAMHIAIGLGRPAVVLIGPTSATEIELYGCGEKVVTDFECSPCYLRVCPKEVTCMEAMDYRTVYQAVLRVIAKAVNKTARNR